MRFSTGLIMTRPNHEDEDWAHRYFQHVVLPGLSTDLGSQLLVKVSNSTTQSQFDSSCQLAAEKRLTVLFMSHLNETKGADLAAHQFARMSRKFPEVDFVIAGVGELGKEWFELVHGSLSEFANLTYLGYLSNSERAKLYRLSTLVVFPFRESRTVLGISQGLIEALASGCSVVCSNEPCLDLNQYREVVPAIELDLLKSKCSVYSEQSDFGPVLEVCLENLLNNKEKDDRSKISSVAAATFNVSNTSSYFFRLPTKLKIID